MNLVEIANLLGIKVKGNLKLNISNICSFDSLESNSIAFVLDERNLKKIDFRSDVAFLIDSSLQNICPKNSNLLLSTNIEKSIVTLILLFKKKDSIPQKISFSDVPKNLKISTFFFKGIDVKFGKNCFVGASVVIGDRVVIGDNVNIANNVVIESDCLIGNNVTIDNGTVIGSQGFGNLRLKNGSWVHIPHIGNVILEDDVSIGSNCCIDRATLDSTVIKKGVVIDNLVHIAHNVTIGENTAIAAKVGIAGSCNIGKRNMIGGMVGIVDHITTANDVVISATSSVTKDLMEPGIYTGIMPISKHSSWKRIALWITKLDKIVRSINIK